MDSLWESGWTGKRPHLHTDYQAKIIIHELAIKVL